MASEKGAGSVVEGMDSEATGPADEIRVWAVVAPTPSSAGATTARAIDVGPGGHHGAMPR